MMKITLFIFAAVLLFAVAFALPKPDEAAPETAEKKPVNLDDLTKLIQEGLQNLSKGVQDIATKENMDKAKLQFEEAFSKVKETLETTIQQITEKKESA